MFVLRAIFIGLSLLLWSANGASAQKKSEGAATSAQGRATIYFLRPAGLLPHPWSPDVKIDGRLVGELGMGSYLVASASRGRRTIEVQGGMDGGFQSDLQVEAGKSYFVEIAPPPANNSPGMQLLSRAFGGITGRELAGRGNIWTRYKFYLLDPQEGRAKIASLRKVGR